MDKENVENISNILLLCSKINTLKFAGKLMKIEESMLSEVTEIHKEEHGI